MAIWAPDHAQLCDSRSVAERAGGRGGRVEAGARRVPFHPGTDSRCIPRGPIPRMHATTIWAPDHAQLCDSRSVAERAGGRGEFEAGGTDRGEFEAGGTGRGSGVVAAGSGLGWSGPVPPRNGFAMYPSWTDTQDAQDGDVGT